MGRSQETFGKKEKEKKRKKKREEKAKKKEERKNNARVGTLDNMIAYVDEFGRITDTPPDPNQKKEEILAENIEIGVPKRDSEPEETIKKGKIIYFDDSKGYGFIKEDSTQEKYFVHINNMIDELGENASCMFELEKGPKGLMAVRVIKA